MNLDNLSLVLVLVVPEVGLQVRFCTCIQLSILFLLIQIYSLAQCNLLGWFNRLTHYIGWWLDLRGLFIIKTLFRRDRHGTVHYFGLGRLHWKNFIGG